MQPRRLRAPRADASVLQDPPLSEAGEVLDANRARLASWDLDFQGRRFGRLRAMARHQALEASKSYLEGFGLALPEPSDPSAPWFVTGHQPELFHPGVWIKNFAVGHLARPHRGVSLNLVVDDDIPKWSSIRVPTLENEGLATAVVDFDEWASGIPYEDWTVASPQRFQSFPDRVRARLGPIVADPVLEAFWPLVGNASEKTDRVGLRFSAARRGVESSWGLRNWEVPLSALCQTEAFGWFASYFLAHLPRFHQVHNQALDDYRRLYGIRSRNHPVPSLHRDGDWLEAPFWAWDRENPSRRPLMVRQRARELDLRIAGGREVLASLPLAPDREACCAVEALADLAQKGVRIRTRALTTTMYARLFLGDLFVHGIGGAKYDELGDEVMRQFFGIEPPHYLTLSMTLWLGLPHGSADPEERPRLDHDLRDLTFNPDRHLDGPQTEEVRALVEAKRRAVGSPQETRGQRVARYFEIRRANESLSGLVESQRAALEARRARLAHALRQQELARGREFSFVLHGRDRLQTAFRQVAPGAFEA